MDFELVDSGWDRRLDQAVRADHSELLIISPFIKRGAAQRLLSAGCPAAMRVLTRFNLSDFFERVSDTAALRLLLEHGALIRGVRNLHAKLYVFGRSRVLLTSANLTESALTRNLEFGCLTTKEDIVESCRTYFDRLWMGAGADLDQARLTRWEQVIEDVAASGTHPTRVLGLSDEGAELLPAQSPVSLPTSIAEAPQSFVKFFGNASHRSERTLAVLEEVRSSGSHFACTYPKRPRRVQSGAIMFMGRLVLNPHDILIYGRAIAVSHVEGRDDASADDIAQRAWKVDWPHYIRVHSAAFLAGHLANGVSLNRLMEELGPRAFASTERRLARGEQEVNPRLSLRRQPDVQLSDAGRQRLSELLEEAFHRNGKLAPADLEQLDWPSHIVNPAGEPLVSA